LKEFVVKSSGKISTEYVLLDLTDKNGAGWLRANKNKASEVMKSVSNFLMEKDTNEVDGDVGPDIYDGKDIIANVNSLIGMYKAGVLGGKVMPEDARPDVIDEYSENNYHFLTLPMALNYQRDSYALWQSAAKAYLDDECRDVFFPKKVVFMTEDMLREKLLKHRVALQPNKHINTWMRISHAIAELFDGDIRQLFGDFDNDVIKIRHFMQKEQKKRFPYLSGPKIFNYWLYVIDSYTPSKLKNRHTITIAPDTHVLQASMKLGLVNGDLEAVAKNRTLVAEKWEEVLQDTTITPIDIHTPLWLWSRAGFPRIT
jgi:hypothetical protein